MEIIFYITLIVLISFSAFQIYKIKKSGNMTENGWQEIRIIAYNAIEEIMELYETKFDKDQFIKTIISNIRKRIVSSNSLTDYDKKFWTEERLTVILKPVIEDLIAEANHAFYS